jgi:hypothetical protein
MTACRRGNPKNMGCHGITPELDDAPAIETSEAQVYKGLGGPKKESFHKTRI